MGKLKILVTGKDGQLGYALQELSENQIEFTWKFTDRSELNITDSINTKLVHFDADIYSSTLFLLFQLDNYTPYYALFDEFGGDEARALYDYLIATDKKIEISATTFDDRYKIVPGKTFMKIY